MYSRRQEAGEILDCGLNNLKSIISNLEINSAGSMKNIFTLNY
jgi:hypothetical protein